MKLSVGSKLLLLITIGEASTDTDGYCFDWDGINRADQRFLSVIRVYPI